jgi:hypothetical protein
MENITPNIYNDSAYDNADLLFNSYYNSSYSDSDLLFNTHHDLLTSNPICELYDHVPYDSPSKQIFEIYNETQIENEIMEVIGHSEDETVPKYDENISCQEEYDDNDSEYDDEENELKLHPEMEFGTWELAESYLKEYAKQQGFCFHKKRCIHDPNDNTITRHRTYKCSHAQTHESQKVILEENRRERDSEMIGCPWHVNASFPKSASGVRITSIIGEHNHNMNPLITEIAPKF